MSEERGFYEAAMYATKFVADAEYCPIDGVLLPPGTSGKGYINMTADDGDLILAATMDAITLEQIRDLVRRVTKLEGAEAKDCAGVGLLRSQVDNLIERVGNLEDVIEAMGDED
jgi:hypothetical protein